MGQGETVLIVDDDKSIRRALTQLLQLAGHEVIECSDANEALAVVERSAGAIGILIADHALPGMSGVALAREVTRTAPWIKTVIVSGHRELQAECRRTPGFHFLPKPFGTAELLSMLRRLFSSRPVDLKRKTAPGSSNQGEI